MSNEARKAEYRRRGWKFDHTIKSEGFVPNFNPMLEAAQREHKAGYAWADIMADTDPRLKTSQNKEGWGIYNREEGSLNAGIALAQAAGIDPKSKGSVPNFATEAEKLDKQLQDRLDRRLKQLIGAIGKNEKALSDIEPTYQAHSKKLENLGKDLEAAKVDVELRENEARDTGDDGGRRRG